MRSNWQDTGAGVLLWTPAQVTAQQEAPLADTVPNHQHYGADDSAPSSNAY